MTNDERAKLLADQEWGRIRKELVAFALSRTKSPEWARDLAQEAILRAHDVERNPWDVERHPKIETFLAGIVMRIISNERTGARTHREFLTDFRASGSEKDVRWTDQAARPDETSATKNLYQRRAALLRQRLANNELALTLLDLMEREIDSAEEQQAVIGCDIKDIRNARKRLFHHAEIVAEEIPLDGDDFDEGGDAPEDGDAGEVLQ